jgi:transcriptional regulator with XRE-family HTH domain
MRPIDLEDIMPPRPSEPLLQLLRELAQKKGMNTAALARAADMDRNRLKSVLSGAEALLVDELIGLSKALEIGPAEMGLQVPEAEPQPESEPEPTPLRPVARIGASAPRPTGPVVDPLGNHAEQLMRVGFGLGCDMFLMLDATQLKESGVPRAVLGNPRFAEVLPIKLDAAYHRHNDPQYMPDGLQVVLSFDSLYTVVLPWYAFKEVRLSPLAPSAVEEEPPPEPPRGGRRGHLRLVE